MKDIIILLLMTIVTILIGVAIITVLMGIIGVLLYFAGDLQEMKPEYFAISGVSIVTAYVLLSIAKFVDSFK